MTPKNIGGIAGGLNIAGEGLVELQVLTRKGRVKKLTRPATNVPDIPVNLIPPQVIMRNNNDGFFNVNGEQAMFEFADGEQVATGFDPITKLPMLHFFADVDKPGEALETALHTCVAKEANQNLTTALKWLLQ